MKNRRDLKIIKFPSNLTEAERQIEAILFAAEEPLDIESIQNRLNTSKNIPNLIQLKQTFDEYKTKYPSITDEYFKEHEKDLRSERDEIIYQHLNNFNSISSESRLIALFIHWFHHS